jgi:hypothetical protein
VELRFWFWFWLRLGLRFRLWLRLWLWLWLWLRLGLWFRLWFGFRLRLRLWLRLRLRLRGRNTAASLARLVDRRSWRRGDGDRCCTLDGCGSGLLSHRAEGGRSGRNVHFRADRSSACADGKNISSGVHPGFVEIGAPP